MERVKELYSIIANKQLGGDPESVCIRVDIIRELERLTGQDFNSTEDFHQKIYAFLLKAGATRSEAERFKQARQQAGLTQGQLADILGVSTQLVNFWETGRRPLNQKAIVWLNSIAQNSGSQAEKGQKSTKIQFRDQLAREPKNG